MAAKKATVASILKFKKEWIFDPPPPFLNIDRAALVKRLAEVHYGEG